MQFYKVFDYHANSRRSESEVSRISRQGGKEKQRSKAGYPKHKQVIII